MPRPQPGLYLAHKPVGVTSFSIVRAVQAALDAEQGRKLGVVHGGTLDPFAHGLLLVLVGQATKLFDDLHAIPKVYEAEVVWGTETDTGDGLGVPVTREGGAARAPTLTAGEIERASRGMVGWHDQVPPPTSAKKIGGEPAYRKVHRGEHVELPPSRVYLHELEWLSHSLSEGPLQRSRVRLVVRGGFYVRSFARDLGRALGCGAHLSTLHRTDIGPWRDPGAEAGEAAQFLGGPPLTGRALLPWLPSRVLTDAEVGALRRGGDVPRGTLDTPDWRLPVGFPGPAEPVPVRGFHIGRLTMLLTHDVGGAPRLRLARELLGGV